jgi:hypothetical protein
VVRVTSVHYDPARPDTTPFATKRTSRDQRACEGAVGSGWVYAASSARLPATLDGPGALPAPSFFIDGRAVDDIPLRLVTGLQRDVEVLRKEGLVLTTPQSTYVSRPRSNRVLGSDHVKSL